MKNIKKYQIIVLTLLLVLAGCTPYPYEYQQFLLAEFGEDCLIEVVSENNEYVVKDSEGRIWYVALVGLSHTKQNETGIKILDKKELFKKPVGVG